MCRDKKTENFLDKRELNWSFKKDFPINRITIDNKILEQIRISGTNPDIVDQYVAAMENGADFPAIVLLRQPGKGKSSEDTYLMITGHHRYDAAVRANGVSRLDAYSIDAKLSPKVIEDLAWDINLLEQTDGYSKEQRLHRGYIHFKKRGYTLEDAAARVAVSPNSLQNYSNAREARDKLIRLGLSPKVLQKLSDSRLSRLHAIINSKFFPEVAKVATALKDRDLADLITGIRKAPADVDRNRLIKEVKANLTPLGRDVYIAPRLSSNGQLNRALKSAKTLLTKTMRDESYLEMPDDAKAEFVKIIKDLRRNLGVFERTLH